MKELLKTELSPLCRELSLPLDEVALERLCRYAELLREWNEKMNLTAITDPCGITRKHFYDSLLFFRGISPRPGARIVDVGTGAGFPGMVLKIVRPDLSLTLLDGLNKRLVFLQEVLKQLDLQAETIHARAEEGGRNPRLREQFDISVARAVARLPVLCEYCLPFVKPGGHFIAMKAKSGKEEVQEAENAVSKLGGRVAAMVETALPDGEERCLIRMEKIRPTDPAFPRPSAKIAKKPL